MQLTELEIVSLEEILSHIEGDEIESYEEEYGEGSSDEPLEQLDRSHVYYHIAVLRRALKNNGPKAKPTRH